MVDTLLEEQAKRGAPRSYLGASAIGDPCERKLWYSLRPSIRREPLSAKSVKAIQDGHAGEAVMIERLRMIPGLTLLDKDETTGGQIGGKLFDGRFQWHVDGVVKGLLQAPSAVHVYEHKQVNQKKFDVFYKLKRESGEKATLAKWDAVYFAQAQVYMRLLDLNRHYMTVATPGGRAFDSCRTEANYVMADALIAKAKRVIQASERPEGISDNSDYFLCKWCDYRETCHR